VARAVAHARAFPRRTGRALVRAGYAFVGLRLTQHAAAIAYRVLFSLAPLAIVLVFAFGLVLRNDQLRMDVVDRVVGWLPVTADGRASVEEAITRLASPTSLLGLVPLATFAWAASGMMGALRNGLEAALAVSERRHAARGKLVDLVLVIGAGVLVIASITVSLAAQIVTSHVGGIADATGLGNRATDRVAAVVLPFVVIAPAILRAQDTAAGAVITTTLLLAISLASTIVFDSAARLSAIYGSITVVLVFLYSIYLYASALLFGAAFAAAWSNRAPLSDDEWHIGLARRIVSPLRRLRRSPGGTARRS
jgi:membrane protein